MYSHFQVFHTYVNHLLNKRLGSVAFKFTAEHTMGTLAPFFGQKNAATNTTTQEYIAAARNLFHHLHHGFIGKGLFRTPIAGDTTKLPFAIGLSPLEKRLALSQHFLSANLPGTQQLRQIMGHRQFGARVVYGDCVFFTISPNEHHSALVLRWSFSDLEASHIRDPTEHPPTHSLSSFQLTWIRIWMYMIKEWMWFFFGLLPERYFLVNDEVIDVNEWLTSAWFFFYTWSIC